jgi:hypothetical protein
MSSEPEEVTQLLCYIRHEMKKLIVALDREKLVERAEIYEHPLSSDNNNREYSLYLGYQTKNLLKESIHTIVNRFQNTLTTLMSTCSISNSIFHIEEITSDDSTILSLRQKEIWNKKKPYRNFR